MLWISSNTMNDWDKHEGWRTNCHVLSPAEVMAYAEGTRRVQCAKCWGLFDFRVRLSKIYSETSFSTRRPEWFGVRDSGLGIWYSFTLSSSFFLDRCLTLQLSQWITNMLNWEGVVITFTAVIRSRGLPSYLAIPLSSNPSSKMWVPFMSHFLPQFLIICINWKFMHMEKIVQNQQYFL